MFIEKLFKKNNKDIIKITALTSENVRLKTSNAELKARVELLEKRFNIGIAGVSVFSDEPIDEKNRENYVGEVHDFYDKFLKKKIILLISEIREELAALSSSSPPQVRRDHYDWFLRGGENMLWKLNEWGETLSGEHQQNIINRTTNDN